jgi:hypothetical protein
MLYFNVIRNIIAEDMYYYFSRNGKIFMEGYELPENANDFLILEISGGESEHGEYLAFEVA